MEKYNTSEIPKSSRITRLVDHLYAKMPEIESYRAKLITESYKETEDQPIITRRAKAFSHILHNIPIIIRDEELIVGSNSIAPRGCQTFPEFSFQWLEDELVVFAAPTSPLARGPVTLEHLAAAPWILRERGSGTREIVDYLLLSHLPKFEMAMELGNSEAIKHAVRHGLGISCLSRRVIEDQLQAGTLSEVAVPLPRLMRTLWRIHYRQKHLSNALRRFLDYCDPANVPR